MKVLTITLAVAEGFPNSRTCEDIAAAALHFMEETKDANPWFRSKDMDIYIEQVLNVNVFEAFHHDPSASR